MKKQYEQPKAELLGFLLKEEIAEDSEYLGPNLSGDEGQEEVD